MNLKDKIIFLYDYISNLEEYRKKSTDIQAMNDAILIEIDCRKFELLSLISIDEVKFKDDSFYMAYNDYEKFYSSDLFSFAEKLGCPKWEISSFTTRGCVYKTLNLNRVFIDVNMLNFNNQLCRDTI